MNKLIKYEKDSVSHLEGMSMVQLSRDLLLKVIESTAILDGNKMSADGLKEAKVVLGYLNSTNNAIKTRMQFFQMTGLKEKINRVKAQTKVE